MLEEAVLRFSGQIAELPLSAEAVWKRAQFALPVPTRRAMTRLQQYFYLRIDQAVLRGSFGLWKRTFLRWSARKYRPKPL